jgi:hypothetical protein
MRIAPLPLVFLFIDPFATYSNRGRTACGSTASAGFRTESADVVSGGVLVGSRQRQILIEKKASREYQNALGLMSTV